MSVRTLQNNFSRLVDMARTGHVETQPHGLPANVSWPASEIGEALKYLAQKSGLPITQDSTPRPQLDKMDKNASPAMAWSSEALERWMTLCAGSLGLEVEPVQSTYAEANHFISGMGPALLSLPPAAGEREPRLVALVKGGPWWVNLVARDGSIQLVRRDHVRNALWADAIGAQRQSVEQVLERAHITDERRPRVQQAILQEMLGAKVRQNGWLVRLPPSAALWGQVQQAGLLGAMGVLIGGYWAQLLLTIGAWWMIGQSVLEGHFEWGWLLGWLLLLFTTAPLQAWVNLTQSELAVGIGAIFKQRLLYGVMRLDPEEIRHQGVGQFLGRVLASDTVEQMGLASGFVALLALFQLAAAVLILAAGVGGWLLALLLTLWVGISMGIGWFYLRRSQAWIVVYREMTHDLVERMVGHRTRLAQEERRHWHDVEDQSLAHYLRLQQDLDQIESQLKVIVPRGWMLVGIGGLVYALLSAHPTSAQVAISLGGILFAYQAFTTIVLGFKSIVNVQLAWREIRVIFHAATLPQPKPHLGALWRPEHANNAPHTAPILTARDVEFRYQSLSRPILQACNLEIYRGEQVLLEGPSGGGKSTLATILAGLRAPQSGLLLLHNVDQQSMGEAAWRKYVVMVPQFHENYIFTGTLAFNLLMGRRWPPSPQDVSEAELLCRELGLGELLERMPAGIQQMVGESGWQLSHGERSRIFIARALLQEADVLILDESFGALDPKNLERALQCVLKRAPTLVVIAHP
ncbi:MAG: ATP-binding cassette domain-containing protein [Caldilineaceae bacterium]|nr:ATP-binding cassette domain-containing protein [Caldilineaceae bacterium]